MPRFSECQLDANRFMGTEFYVLESPNARVRDRVGRRKIDMGFERGSAVVNGRVQLGQSFPTVPQVFRRKAIGCTGATEPASKIRKRYQTNELAVDSTEFGTRGSEVQILSPRPIPSSS